MGDVQALIASYAQPGKTDRSPFAVRTLRRIQFMRRSFGLCGWAMEVALCKVPMYRGIAGLVNGLERLTDTITTLCFGNLLEANISLGLQILGALNITSTAKGLQLKSGNLDVAVLTTRRMSDSTLTIWSSCSLPGKYSWGRM